MANPYFVNSMGGFDLGGAVTGLGQQYRQSQEREKLEQKQLQQQDIMKRAYTGDAQAMEELFSTDPRLSLMLEQREQQKAQKIGAENLMKSKQAEVDWGIRWKQASPEQKEALLQEALDNPLIDIDESDVGIQGEQADLAVNSMLYGHMGKDQYNALGLSPQGVTKQKLSNVQRTESGELIGQDDQGNWKKADLPKGVSLEKKQPLVSIGKGQSKEQEEVGKYRGQAFNQILKQSKDASKTIATLNTMDKLADKALSGSLADTKLMIGKFAKMLGADVEGLTESEAFISMANSLTLDKAGQLSGALSDKDIAFLQATVPQLSQTKEGRKKVIGMLKDVAKIEREMARKAQQFKKQNKGSFDPVEFEEWVKEQRGEKDVLSDYFEETTVYGEEITLPSGIKVKRVG